MKDSGAQGSQVASSSEKNHKPMMSLLGPALVAAITCMDPGNVTANLSTSANCGYLLLWVLVASNLMAMVVQYLSARYGLVMGRSLTKGVTDRLGSDRPGRLAYWVQTEIVAAATDVAEIIGGATALYLLFGTPVLLGSVIVGVVSLGLLLPQGGWSQCIFENVIVAFLLVITVGFLAGLFVTGSSLGEMANGILPRFQGAHTVVLAAPMLGAIVTPHAVYLHSRLVHDREYKVKDDVSLRQHLQATRIDIFGALALAGSVSIGMLCLTAEVLPGAEGTDSIEGAHAAVTSAFGPVVGVLSSVGLLASGLASPSVGCYVGDLIMRDLLKVRVPMLVCRVVTIIPALPIIVNGTEPTWVLVLGQVMLSIDIPLALIPLVYMTPSRAEVGIWASTPLPRRVARVICGFVIALNMTLVVLALMGKGQSADEVEGDSFRE